MKYLLSYLTFVASICYGNALKCYVCAGSTTSDCAKGILTSMAIQECPNVTESAIPFASPGSPDYGRTTVACLEAIGTGYKPFLVMRGCGVFPSQTDHCKFINKFVPVKRCKTCSSDFCDKDPLKEEIAISKSIEQPDDSVAE